MAKKEKVNVSAAIRDALGAHPKMTPLEIVAVLKAQGLTVSPTYVSNIKSTSKKKGRRGRKPGRAVKTMMKRRGDGNGFANVPAALEFIKAAGGLAAAQEALAKVEEIRKAVR